MGSAACIIGNSSSALREGAFLGTPAVNIGSRQSNRERSQNVIDVDSSADAIEAAIRTQISHGRYARDPLFGDGNAGQKIAEILANIGLHSTQKYFQDRAVALVPIGE
jgi:UDP-N-acetylglucosamine 2-epimerase